jgi:hypothetical protein
VYLEDLAVETAKKIGNRALDRVPTKFAYVIQGREHFMIVPWQFLKRSRRLSECNSYSTLQSLELVNNWKRLPLTFAIFLILLIKIHYQLK